MGAHQFTAQIPEYLRHYIVQQDSSVYTPIDHASWRFILKISKKFFAEHAHQKYLKGLSETGISAERIPLIEEMDHCLAKFGWRAVAVSGFIPPSVFMEFMSLGVLTIACDMRKLENLSYTPAPDIVHEAAGHAPIIADPEYRAYLRTYGEVSRKAIYSKRDMDVYRAVRNLSDTKEDPQSTPAQIAAAQKQLDDASTALDHLSEASLLARMGWWTFEYGLVGSLEHPKIFGAGLLSSVGESYHCLNREIKKVPFSVNCIETSYDITKPQPQLFVTPDFKTLEKGLDELADTMAFRHGGIEGLKKAQRAAETTTTVFDSGIQVSGILQTILTDPKGAPCYLGWKGPVQLALADREIRGQGPAYHKEGFGSPVGTLKGGKLPSKLTDTDLATYGFSGEAKSRLEFESGVVVEGVLKRSAREAGQTQLIVFENCQVRFGEQILFQPEWGTYDMACGAAITSVFGGAADRAKYLEYIGFDPKPGKQKSNLTADNRDLNKLYAVVREIREKGAKTQSLASAEIERLNRVSATLQGSFSDDWLLRIELLELDQSYQLKSTWSAGLKHDLKRIAGTGADRSEMIKRGLEVL